MLTPQKRVKATECKLPDRSTVTCEVYDTKGGVTHPASAIPTQTDARHTITGRPNEFLECNYSEN